MRFFLFIYLIVAATTGIAQTNSQRMQINLLEDQFYIYTTYNIYKGEPVPANGMYLVTNQGVVLFDTPWDTSQFQPLLDTIEKRHHQPVVLCVSTHFHDDRTAGLEYYHRKGIRTYTTVRTDELSKKTGKNRASFLISNDTVFTVGGYSFQTFYPGEGHTPDNIVVWFQKQRIIYGGCLIKSAKDEDLGYLGDANTSEYANTIQRVRDNCKRPRHIVVGHGDWSDLRSLQHTLDMAKRLQ